MIVHIDSESKWDVYDLRNTVKTFVLNELAVIGYLTGLVYDLELTRIVNQKDNIDFVFGIDIPCIVERNKAINFDETLIKIRKHTIGLGGVLLHRYSLAM